jgi:hypothetical protein
MYEEKWEGEKYSRYVRALVNGRQTNPVHSFIFGTHELILMQFTSDPLKALKYYLHCSVTRKILQIDRYSSNAK